MTNSLNRRKFLRGSAVVGAAALATPAIADAHGTTIKMQAAWGGGIFLENAQSFAARVNEMSGGSLTIEVLSVDAVVKTSQMQDAVHRGVLDAAHYVPAYWYGKSKSASLFGTGPCFGWSSQEVLGWVYAGYIVVKLLIITGAHSDVAWDKPLYAIKWLSPVMWVVERTISTPATHHAHHGRHAHDPATQYKGNYGNLLFFWDVLFGTAKITREYPESYGVENLAPATLGQQLLWPIFPENKDMGERVGEGAAVDAA